MKQAVYTVHEPQCTWQTTDADDAEDASRDGCLVTAVMDEF